MDEGKLPEIKKEGFTGEKEAQEIARGLENASAKLQEIDPSTVTPEQYQKMKGQVDMVIGIVAVFVGYKIVEMTPNMDTGYVKDFLDLCRRFVQEARLFAVLGTGIVTITAGFLKFIEGWKKFEDGAEAEQKKESQKA